MNVWIWAALVVALVAVILGVSWLWCWREPVRRGAVVLDFTPRPRAGRKNRLRL